MQALTTDQYRRLERLARAWEHGHLEAARRAPGFNPRLGADALCFQSLVLPGGEACLVGALITPLSLSLALVPEDEVAPPPPSSPVRRVTLPSGVYPFRVLWLDGPDWLWGCELLDDLSDVDSLQEGSRLAQRLMERVMTPEAPAS